MLNVSLKLSHFTTKQSLRLILSTKYLENTAWKHDPGRWTFHVLYNTLDLAAINALIFYKETTGVNIFRKNFIFQLSEELSSDHHDEKILLLVHCLTYEIQVCENQTGLCKKNRSNYICIKGNKYVVQNVHRK